MPQNLQFIVIPLELLQITIYLTDTAEWIFETHNCTNLHKKAL